MTILCAALVSGATLSAQETADTINVAARDTLVVIVKHEKADAFFEKTGKPFKKGYKAVDLGKSYQSLCFCDEGFLLYLNTFASSKKKHNEQNET